ncbi:MAG: nuclear transport factor 2 family protein [Cellulomonas sp.]
MAMTPQQADAAWHAAWSVRDTEGAATFLHPEYALVLVHPAPARVARAEWLATLPAYVVTGWHTIESAWDVQDGVAVHLQKIYMAATVDGTDRSGIFILTDTWLSTPDGWQVWRRHSTPLHAGEIPRPRADGSS